MISIPPLMLATDGGTPFTSDAWLMEVKFDGYRCAAAVENGLVRLATKNGNECTHAYPEVVRALAKLQGGPHVLDGEACVLVDGVSDFNLFHAERGTRKPARGAPAVTFCAFDLLVVNGEDIMSMPLHERKRRLRELLAPIPKISVLYVDDLPADADLFAAMIGAGLQIEGVVAKRRESAYLPGERSRDWLKIKRPGWRIGRRWMR